MAPTPEPTGDKTKLPSFDEVISDSPIPAPPEVPSPAAQDAAPVPPVPAPPVAAPAEVPTLGPATQAPVENPALVETLAGPALDAITEAEEAHTQAAPEAQQIPEALAELGVEPLTDGAEDGVDAAEVPTTSFPLAPPPPMPASSGYEREGEAYNTDFPHPEPLADAPSTHQIPRVRPIDEEAVPAAPTEEATEVLSAIPAAPTVPATASSTAHEPKPTKETPERSGKLIDPTRPALLFGLVLFLFGAIWGPWMATRPVTDLDLGQSLRAGLNPDQNQSEPAPNLTTTPPPAPSVTPVISSVQVLSWNNDDGDHPDRAINMIDSNPSTSWSSRWFDNNQFRDETSVTIVVKLQQKATVSSVTLNMDPATSGGEIVVRNVTDPANPRGGTELASSALSPTTTIQLPEPVETDTIALQFRSMPKGQDGRNWAWISELTVQ